MLIHTGNVVLFFEFPAVAKTNTPEIKWLSATFAHPMAHMNHWKNTKKEKHKENCSHRSSTENLKAFRVIHRLRFQGQCFRGLLFSTSDRGQRDTKQVVGNLISLCNITVFQGNLSDPNHLKLLQIGQRNERTKKTKQFYNKLILFREKKRKLTENRIPRKEQWHLKRCVINRACNSREVHVQAASLRVPNAK